MEYPEALVMDRQGHRLERRRPRPATRYPWVAALLALLPLGTGCVSLGPWLACDDKPPTGDVCQVVAAWHNSVVFTPDPTHNGDPTPGISGRLYLFGPTLGYPVAGDGSLAVDLYLDPPGTTTPVAGVPPVERWEIDKDTLHRLLRKDAIGWGYTLFLPWGTYRKDISQVRLRVRYQPAKGGPLFAETPRLTLGNENTLPQALPTQVKRPQAPSAALAKRP